MMHVDSKSKLLKILIESLPGVPLVNLSTKNKHVPDTKQQTRVVKEQCRVTQHGLPFQRMPNILTTYIVINSVKMLGLFPTKGGISDNLTPKTIIPGKTLD